MVIFKCCDVDATTIREQSSYLFLTLKIISTVYLLFTRKVRKTTRKKGEGELSMC